MAERTVKLWPLKEAIAKIPDGARIILGGFSIYQRPMAAVHELIRAGKKNLTIIGSTNTIELDMLVGAGCVSKVETSYVGLEKFGLAKNFRRAMQAGNIKIEYYSEMLAWDRFRADREGMEFWPVDFLGGSDILTYNDKIIPFKSPISGKQLYAVPAAKADFALIHAYAGDKYGNIQHQEKVLMPQTIDFDIARGCDNTIVTVEKLLRDEEVSAGNQRTIIPAFKTSALSHVPFGSHPTPTLGVTKIAETYFRAYAQAAEADDSFKAYLDKYVYGTNSFEEYMDLVKSEFSEELEVM